MCLWFWPFESWRSLSQSVAWKQRKFWIKQCICQYDYFLCGFIKTVVCNTFKLLVLHLQKVLWLSPYRTLVFMHISASGNVLFISSHDAHQVLTEQLKIYLAHSGHERSTSLKETWSSPLLWASPYGMGTDDWQELTGTHIISVSAFWTQKFPRWLQNTNRSAEVPIVMGIDIWEVAWLKRMLRKHSMCLSLWNAAFEFFCVARLEPLDSAGSCPMALKDPKWESKETLSFSFVASWGMCFAGLIEFSKKFCLGQQPIQPAVTRANERTPQDSFQDPYHTVLLMLLCDESGHRQWCHTKILPWSYQDRVIFIIMQTIIQMPRLNQ